MNNLTHYLSFMIADGLVFLIIGITVYDLFIKHREEKEKNKKEKEEKAKKILIGGLATLWVAKLLSVTVGKNSVRPFERLHLSPQASFVDNPGFPSDHSLFVWTLFFALFFFSKSSAVKFIVGALAFTVCVGRVMALVHTPMDVLGGFLVAGTVATLLYAPKTIYRLLHRK